MRPRTSAFFLLILVPWVHVGNISYEGIQSDSQFTECESLKETKTTTKKKGIQGGDRKAVAVYLNDFLHPKRKIPAFIGKGDGSKFGNQHIIWLVEMPSLMKTE
jgi:hypothetical protein